MRAPINLPHQSVDDYEEALNLEMKQALHRVREITLKRAAIYRERAERLDAILEGNRARRSTGARETATMPKPASKAERGERGQGKTRLIRNSENQIVVTTALE